MKNKERKERKSKDGFTIVPNTILYDATLSIAAKGLLAEFLSNPPGWITYQKELFGRSSDGFARQKRALKLLIEKKYIRQERTNRADGKFEYKYHLNEELIFGKSKPDSQKPAMVIPYMEEPNVVIPLTVEPSMENAPNSNTDIISNTDINNTDSSNMDEIKTEEIKNSKRKEDTPIIQEEKKQEEKISPPSFEEVKAFFESNGYNVAGATAFFKEFNNRNWHTLTGEPVENWKGMAKYFFKNSTGDYFELNEEVNGFIKTLGTRCYEKIYANEYAKRSLSDEYPHRRFTENQILSLLREAFVQYRLDSKQKAKEHFTNNKINNAGFYEFKASLGLKKKNDGGKKHI